MKESYTIYELAAAWGCSWRTVWRMIQRGELTAFRVGRSWRISGTERQRVEQNGIFSLTRSAGS